MDDNQFLLYLEKKVKRTIKKYDLLTKTDKVAVAVSGGKDSTVCIYLLKKFGYNVDAITIDANIGNYTKKNLENIKSFCKKNNIKLKVVSFKKEFGMSLCYIKSILESKGYSYSSCMLCGIIKRYLLNKYSRKYDYLATGHNLDDESQSFIMNLFRNDIKLSLKQGPKIGISKNNYKDFDNQKKLIRRIKPLYFINEEEIKRYSKIMDFPVNYGICPCSKDAYRRKFKNLLNEFEIKHPSVKYNIIKFQESMKEKISIKEDYILNQCISCGEPSSNKKCKVCEILESMKTEKRLRNGINEK